MNKHDEIKHLTECPYAIPETVDEAVDVLLNFTDKQNLKDISQMKKEDLIRLHHGFGTCIRNNFNMWEEGSMLVEDCAKIDDSIVSKENGYVHPDDASGVVIKAFWEKLIERV